MTYRRRPNKPCAVCRVLFPPRANAKTCSDECGAALRKKWTLAYARRNAPRIAKYAKKWRAENPNRPRPPRDLDHSRAAGREYQRKRRETDPARFMENRDPEAVKQRARERWRRGQAARRARMREAQQ